MPKSRKRGGKKAHNKRVQHRNNVIYAEAKRFKEELDRITSPASMLGSVGVDGIDKAMLDQIRDKTSKEKQSRNENTD